MRAVIFLVSRNRDGWEDIAPCGQIYEVMGKIDKEVPWTYNDEAADGHQVPEDIFLGPELGVRRLQLLQVLIGYSVVSDKTRRRGGWPARPYQSRGP